jgi:hypothetical protein
VGAGSRVVGGFPKGGEEVKARWMLLATLAAVVAGIMALASTVWALTVSRPRNSHLAYAMARLDSEEMAIRPIGRTPPST